MLPEESENLDQRRSVVTGTATHAQEVLAWRNWGDYDYVAARRLLLDNLLIQGAALANTALEKYLKAIFAVRQTPIPRIHDPLELYRRITPRGTLSLDEHFLALLVKAYKLRYPDELKPGFNVVIAQAPLLNALDKSVFEIKSHFEFRKPDGTPIAGFLDHLLQEQDPRIITDNSMVGVITPESLFGRPSAAYELRILDNGARLEIHYVTDKIGDPSFNREAWVPINDKQFNLAHPPRVNTAGALSA